MAKNIKNAFSLIELLVVIVIIATLVALAIPAINAMQKSFASTGAESMIGTALSTARTLAISNNQYAGVRFQKAGDPNANDTLKADQYMIFIIYDKKKTDLVDGFVAVEGYRPIKLPSNIGVMDMKLGVGTADVNSNTDIDTNEELMDTTAFSIIFSPTGKLITRDVRIRNKDGIPDTEARRLNPSSDDVFNKKGDVDKKTPALVAMVMGNETGMFYQDDYFGASLSGSDTPTYPDVAGPNPNLGLGQEQSRNKFVIYNRDKFRKLDPGQRYTQYLGNLPMVYINAYTGEIIK